MFKTEKIARLGLFVLVTFGLAACNLNMENEAALPPSAPHNPTMTSSEPAPETPTAARAQSWVVLAPGLERRLYFVDEDPTLQIMALRVDPALYSFRVHYRPGDPFTVQEWQAALPQAAAFINANFFDPQNRIVGLLIADGVAHGQAYQQRGGMFAIQDDQPLIRVNALQPYIPGEPLTQAVQGFPMLVQDGAQAYTSRAVDRLTRRTAVGIDAEGRVILMTTPLLGPTLLNLSAFLAAEMNLVQAFNLDGGGSTLLFIASENYSIASRDPVPAVLAVYARP